MTSRGTFIIYAVFVLALAFMPKNVRAQSTDEYLDLSNELKNSFGLQLEATTNDDWAFEVLNEAIELDWVPIEGAEDAPNDVPIARVNTYMIQFEPSTSLEEITDLLTEYGLEVADEPTKNEQLSRIGVLIVQPIEGVVTEFPLAIDNSLTASEQLLQHLRSDPLIRSASPDLVVVTEDFPPSPPATPPSEVATWDWRVMDACVPGMMSAMSERQIEGNWGLKLARFPAAWRIVQNRLEIEGRMPEIKVAVLDAGFELNEDLEFVVLPNTENRPHDHGTHVAGIIGATFDNEFGIDGASPWARIVAVPHSRQLVNMVEGRVEEQLVALQSDIMATLISLLDEPDLKVVNVSLGYAWGRYLQINPSDAEFTSLRNDIANTGIMIHSVMSLFAAHGVLFVSAAGNDSAMDMEDPRDVSALWGSALNWAALTTESAFVVSNVIVVEAIDHDGARAPFSNSGGHVSAPGTNVLSTIGGGFALDSGTSMAAPHVTALATLLIAYDPEITVEEIARAIHDGARPATEGAAPQIDALDALVAHDPSALRFMADLNLDGEVGPADLALYNEHKLLLEETLTPNVSATVEPDVDDIVIEAVTNQAGDGASEEEGVTFRSSQIGEAFWPIIDLNGSGISTDDGCDKVLIGGHNLSDFDVLRLAWTDPDVSLESIASNACSTCGTE